MCAACSTPGPVPQQGGAVENHVPQPSYTPLTLGPEEQAAARSQAYAVLRAFARPELGPRAWWKGLRPHLSASAQNDYVGTDPARVPARRITGPARLTPASLPALARVAVPTDAGIYLVLLSRTPGQPWTVQRLTAPEPVH